MITKELEELGKPYKIFTDNVENDTYKQFFDAMKLDDVVKGALMPDCHFGYTLPIGSVIASESKIYASFVGFDIGCGVCAVNTTFKKQDIIDNADQIFSLIYRNVPVGFTHNKEPVEWNKATDLDRTKFLDEAFLKSGLLQLGTLGGGNHFIEIGYDESDTVWIIVHSGSRGLGHTTASHYMKKACFLHTGVNKAKDGHYGFHIESKDGLDYIKDLNFCLAFALKNRAVLIERTVKAISHVCDGGRSETFINRNHNHAVLEKGLWVHRKGATHAQKGMEGVIPGNMRDGSFIVEGLGNEDSLWSSSHGAGRALSRKKAKATIKIEDFKKEMQGITARVKMDTIDESPGAYKDIFYVMNEQKELVKVIHHVQPLINIKG